ncbi:MAG: hypothetical protein IKN62_02900 [Elusimicrobia bacterium]|nr:hypothetical protein [Elusimicrobiota bacterium]
MSIIFESVNRFQFALREVLILIEYSAKEEKQRDTSNVFLKSALILLTIKLEVFLEDISSEYISFINKELKLEQISDEIKLGYSKQLFKSFYDVSCHPHKKSESIEYMKQLSNLWQNIGPTQINIETKFNYGNHGEDEINFLFEKIGIENIWDKITITKKQNTIDGGVEITIVDFKNIVNGITYQRNNIIHQDATISFTKEEISEYVDYCKQLSVQIAKFLEKELNKYKKIKC